jgi:glutamyl-tRNA reductase
MVIGLNHRTAPVAMRERFWMSESAREHALRLLRQAEGVQEVVVLTTSDRTELLVWAEEPTLAASSLLQFLCAEHGLMLSEWEHFYRLLDEAALVHVFSVASGLDSTVLGEPQIIAEIDAAWKQARSAGATGRVLDAVLQKALAVSQRVHGETGIGNLAGPTVGAADGMVHDNAAERQSAAAEAERMVAAEAREFRRNLPTESVAPTIVALRNRLDQICHKELDSFTREHGPFSREEDHDLRALAAQVTQKIANSVARELNELPDKPDQEEMTAAVERLFHLETCAHPEAPVRGRAASRH